VRAVQGHCDRARQWASAGVDGELSTFERALLADHLERCSACREFNLRIGDLTTALRAAPRERVEGVTIGRIRRRVHLRLAPAAAAMAFLAVGLGSVVASTDLKGGPAHNSQPGRIVPVAAAPEALNLSAADRLHRLVISRVEAAGARSLRGGPVVRRR
jgi:predicted anti-sigma-YlaC factor YlaD